MAAAIPLRLLLLTILLAQHLSNSSLFTLFPVLHITMAPIDSVETDLFKGTLLVENDGGEEGDQAVTQAVTFKKQNPVLRKAIKLTAKHSESFAQDIDAEEKIDADDIKEIVDADDVDDDDDGASTIVLEPDEEDQKDIPAEVPEPDEEEEMDKLDPVMRAAQREVASRNIFDKIRETVEAIAEKIAALDTSRVQDTSLDTRNGEVSMV